MVVKKGYSYLRYYSLTQFTSVPSFVNEVRLRFMSDYVKRFSSEKNQSVVSPKMLITYDLFDSFPYFSDLFICSVARSFVFGKAFCCPCDILILKIELLSQAHLGPHRYQRPAIFQLPHLPLHVGLSSR